MARNLAFIYLNYVNPKDVALKKSPDFVRLMVELWELAAMGIWTNSICLIMLNLNPKDNKTDIFNC